MKINRFGKLLKAVLLTGTLVVGSAMATEIEENLRDASSYKSSNTQNDTKHCKEAVESESIQLNRDEEAN